MSFFSQHLNKSSLLHLKKLHHNTYGSTTTKFRASALEVSPLPQHTANHITSSTSSLLFPRSLKVSIWWTCGFISFALYAALTQLNSFPPTNTLHFCEATTLGFVPPLVLIVFFIISFLLLAFTSLHPKMMMLTSGLFLLNSNSPPGDSAHSQGFNNKQSSVCTSNLDLSPELQELWM